MKENQLLLKDLLELWKIKSTDIWLQYQKMCIDNLNYIVDKYKNAYHEIVKTKPVPIKDMNCIYWL